VRADAGEQRHHAREAGGRVCLVARRAHGGVVALGLGAQAGGKRLLRLREGRRGKG